MLLQHSFRPLEKYFVSLSTATTYAPATQSPATQPPVTQPPTTPVTTPGKYFNVNNLLSFSLLIAT